MGKAANFIKEYARMLSLKAEGSPKNELPFHAPIVLSREYGSGGRDIAMATAERLHYKFVDKEILEDIAARAHVAPDLVKLFDERNTSIFELLGSGIIRGESLHPEEFDRYLKMTLQGVLKLGSVVVLGRGAVFLSDPGRSLRVRIVAPVEIRVKNLMERKGISDKQARQRLQNIDLERRAFHKRVYGKDTTMPDSYDIAVNTEFLAVNDAVDLILGAYTCVCKESVTEVLTK